MEQFADHIRAAKARMDKAADAAARGDWVGAERALREAQLGARQLRLMSLTAHLQPEA